MNDKLKEIEEVFIGQVQKSDTVLGAWRFGSETHGLSDDLSDVDIVDKNRENILCISNGIKEQISYRKAG